MKRTENKVAVVTVGALGIGRETCLLLANEGAKVAVTDVHNKKGMELAQEINQSDVDIPPYHASKGAVRILDKNNVLTYAKDNLRVNSVHPGFIWTPLFEALSKKKPESRKQLDSLYPMGHVGEPTDITYGILYLVSDESKFVTGSELVINGDYTCK